MGSFFKRRFIKRQAVVTALTFTLLLFVPILSHLIASAPDIINASAAFAAEKKEAVESPAAKRKRNQR